jgi:hypothetical protein
MSLRLSSEVCGLGLYEFTHGEHRTCDLRIRFFMGPVPAPSLTAFVSGLNDVKDRCFLYDDNAVESRLIQRLGRPANTNSRVVITSRQLRLIPFRGRLAPWAVTVQN